MMINRRNMSMQTVLILSKNVNIFSGISLPRAKPICTSSTSISRSYKPLHMYTCKKNISTHTRYFSSICNVLAQDSSIDTKKTQDTSAEKEEEEVDEKSTQTQEDRIIITKSCAERILKVNEKNKTPNGKLRVMVLGGKGCGGFSYDFTFCTNVTPDDIVFQKALSDDNGGRDAENGSNVATVVIDTLSMDTLKGSTLDYVNELGKSRFAIVDNPNAEMNCSCGISFSPK